MKKKLLIIISTLFLLSCGYSVVDKSNENNYKIADISSSGERRINHNIKSKILLNSLETSENLLSININTKKEKRIKDKNVNNEITSYQLSITTNVTYEISGKIQSKSFSINQTGDYKVSDQRLNTLNNEKKLIETLTDNIVEQIFTKLKRETNDS